ncbi:MAG: penicillin-binding transpeptidase domain-containing protein [Eubacteriales bacterium]|nr:penicillin-binding transpeptidase domain-containing protein [Eubacteriales bacterium]MDY3332536.1 penicillin-binding transpeptidase domain-containing protein [Gallibacter sp.]
MKKMQRRAIICMAFSLLLLLGLGVYVYKYINEGTMWVSYPANKHIFNKGRIASGTIVDRNGEILIKNSSGNPTQYNQNKAIRTAMVHTTGDAHANISTGANVAFSNKLVGYNIITGLYSASGEGSKITMTVDANLSNVAAQALGNRNGTVGVYNYKTGEILCMVSTPSYDPYNPPSYKEAAPGTFINKLISGRFTPGSTFKTVTAGAALQNLGNIKDWYYTCHASDKYGTYEKDRVTCYANTAHGSVNLKRALQTSCNCYFGRLSNKVGSSNMKKYVDAIGLTSSYNIDGIKTKSSKLIFDDNDLKLAWAGIGQGEDEVNPASMMMYMGTIANDGVQVSPKLIKDISSSSLLSKYNYETTSNEVIDKSIATDLKAMLRNNVQSSYGQGNYPGLKLCAKTGTAEVGKSKQPHAWMVGFLDDPENPYAFVVLVENGGVASSVAGNLVNTVMQAAVGKR